MPLYLGVDDTDSLRGMCTTFLATELVRALRAWDLIGYPRLVRLNPNIPWKTRGNGAICLRIGWGRGPTFPVGEIDGRPVLAHERGESVPPSEKIGDIVAGVVEAWAEFDDPATNPAFVLLKRPPSPALYWQAVRGIVAKEEVLAAIRPLGLRRQYKNGRGVIGASAATAWRPRDRTYEILAYRERSRWGSRREVSRDSVRRLDIEFPSTFNNYDWDNDRVVITPRTPCPILCGIRGDDPWVLPAALASVGGESPNRWLLFETNQGTDNHVLRNPGEARPWTSIDVAGTVAMEPRSLPGGHVLFRLRWREILDVIAYEPSKQFRRVVRALAPGDFVRVVGAVRDAPRSLNLEKLEIVGLVPLLQKGGNPQCPKCGKRMKSTGRAAAFRCRRCGTRRPRSDAVLLERPRIVSPGWHEPPVGSRRHLSLPLKRMAISEKAKERVVGRTPKRASPSFSRGADTLPTTAHGCSGEL